MNVQVKKVKEGIKLNFFDRGVNIWGVVYAVYEFVHVVYEFRSFLYNSFPH